MHKVLLVVFLSATSLGIPGGGQTKTVQVVQKNLPSVHNGEDMFLKKCFQCHSVLEGQTRLGPSLYQEMKGSRPKRTASEIRRLLKNGKGKMPSFSESLTQEDTDNLLAYIRTL